MSLLIGICIVVVALIVFLIGWFGSICDWLDRNIKD